ncbi:glycosyltransferase [Aminipila butyrica]|uniref:Glycosyltransferase n=1 Tax=Aminipila butyrica TaxID=433296 RepID=A0A858BSL7_9FIRM|nr:bifunctional glycosyltransferase family 2/GtrA family protein [Aminipila butyrica]QIB68971.1 glycosyltransferase [Aminipila butyrica]
MSKEKGQNLVVIPSLEPDDRLLQYVQELNSYGLTDIILVDDGSGEEYQWIFKKLEESCIVLHHEKNQGKGCALKTGFQYIKDNFHHVTCVVTADSDGQHAAEDVYQLVKEAGKYPDSLTLGVRDFAILGLPTKSWVGNRFSSFLFEALYGQRLCDTQTGLRAFCPQLLDFMLQVKGARFEYEIQMLISCVRSGVPLITKPIQVIYEDNNAGTHFKPVGDSLRVVGTLLSSFMLFLLSSISSAAVDLGIAWFLMDLLRPLLQQQLFLRIFTATMAARVISIGVNYLLNRYLVFREGKSSNRSLWRYLILCVVVLSLSATGVYVLNRGFSINEKIGKIICDGVLFLVSYRVQQRWVFKKGDETIDEQGSKSSGTSST